MPSGKQAGLLQTQSGLAGKGCPLISAGPSGGVSDRGTELPSLVLGLADLKAGEINKPAPLPSQP